MVQLGKILRWFFGLNAVLFGAISFRYLLTISQSLTFPGRDSGDAVLRLSAYAVMAGFYGAAFFLMRKGGRKARFWALCASGINIPFYWIVQPAWMWTAAGVIGLVVFWRQEVVDQLAVKPAKAPRTRGDGTSSSMDLLANVSLFVGFLAASSLWASWAIRVKIPDSQGFLVQLLFIEGALLLTTLAHEGGHALAAILLKMKVRRFVVGPLEGSFRSGKWLWGFRWAGFLGAPGGVGVVPTAMHDLRKNHVLVAAAGPVASLALGLTALWAAISSQGHFWEPAWKLAAYTCTFSLLACLFNLIPVRPESVYSDGARIYQLLGRSGWADVHLALSMASCTMASSMRPRDCDLEVQQRAMAFLKQGMEALVLRLQAFACYHDRGQVPDAISALEQAEAVFEDSVRDMRADLYKNLVFGNAFLKRDASRARHWWERMEAKGNATQDAEYWFTVSALLLAEGRVEKSAEAWRKSSELAANFPNAGSYEYERDCIEQLRIAIAAARNSQDSQVLVAAC